MSDNIPSFDFDREIRELPDTYSYAHLFFRDDPIAADKNSETKLYERDVNYTGLRHFGPTVALLLPASAVGMYVVLHYMVFNGPLLKIDGIDPAAIISSGVGIAAAIGFNFINTIKSLQLKWKHLRSGHAFSRLYKHYKFACQDLLGS